MNPLRTYKMTSRFVLWWAMQDWEGDRRMKKNAS